jgi:phosphopentomutase
VRRVFVVVLDACGVGALPDAAAYGDAGADTLGHLAAAAGGLRLPTLERLGLGSIAAIGGVEPAAEPVLHGRLAAIGYGKDSMAGHWGLMGLAQTGPPPTYPEGFPLEVLAVVSDAADRQVLCNLPYNGIGAIEDFGAEHVETGALIVYTSQDSVLQIAAHEEVVAPEELYAICARVRSALRAEHAVGRVIARPFRGRAGAFVRTAGRHDLSLPPPARSYLDEIRAAGVPVHAVGKAGELFSGVGIDVAHPGADNAEAIARVDALLGDLEHGMVFANLVDTDQVHGHRHDVEGFAGALGAIDRAVAGWLERLEADDLLVLTADHGCDVTAPHTDHTREYAPLLAVFPGHASRRHDGRLPDVGASALEWLTGRAAPGLPGQSFLTVP